MAAQSRSSSPGRTPPFILVGLLVLVCFLAYNYWSLSSQNSILLAELDTARLKERDVGEENKQNKESLDAVRVELSKAKLSIESHRAQSNQWAKEKSAFNEQVSGKTSEVDSCKKSLETCNENQRTEQEAKVAAQSDKEVLQKEIQALKDAPKICDKVACNGPIREVVVVAAKLTGTDALGNALSKAGFDAAQLLEGVNLPAPQAPAAAAPAEPAKDAAPAAAAAAPAASQVNVESSQENEAADGVYLPASEAAPVVESPQGEERVEAAAPQGSAEAVVADQVAEHVPQEVPREVPQEVPQENVAPVENVAAPVEVPQENAAPVEKPADSEEVAEPVVVEKEEGDEK